MVQMLTGDSGLKIGVGRLFVVFWQLFFKFEIMSKFKNYKKRAIKQFIQNEYFFAKIENSELNFNQLNWVKVKLVI